MDFTNEEINNVWEKGSIVSDNNPDEWRKDQCGAWIGFKFYGNRNSQYGWEIDHINPESGGGSNNLANLRPLQWENNANKQAGRLGCAVTSFGNQNVRR